MTASLLPLSSKLFQQSPANLQLPSSRLQRLARHPCTWPWHGNAGHLHVGKSLEGACGLRALATSFRASMPSAACQVRNSKLRPPHVNPAPSLWNPRRSGLECHPHRTAWTACPSLQPPRNQPPASLHARCGNIPREFILYRWRKQLTSEDRDSTKTMFSPGLWWCRVLKSIMTWLQQLRLSQLCESDRGAGCPRLKMLNAEGL